MVVKRIKVDGVKAVILSPKPTQHSFRDKLNWSAYKMNLVFQEKKAA